MIYLGADHAGFELKEIIKRALTEKKGVVCDLSEAFEEGDDYPDIARRLSEEVRKDRRHRGILICGSGGGVCMVANKVSGIRAGQAESPKAATLLRQDDDANILCLGSRVISAATALIIVRTFLKQRASPAARHRRRLGQMEAIEQQHL